MFKIHQEPDVQCVDPSCFPFLFVGTSVDRSNSSRSILFAYRQLITSFQHILMNNISCNSSDVNQIMEHGLGPAIRPTLEGIGVTKLIESVSISFHFLVK